MRYVINGHSQWSQLIFAAKRKMTQFFSSRFFSFFLLNLINFKSRELLKLQKQKVKFKWNIKYTWEIGKIYRKQWNWEKRKICLLEIFFCDDSGEIRLQLWRVNFVNSEWLVENTEIQLKSLMYSELMEKVDWYKSSEFTAKKWL